MATQQSMPPVDTATAPGAVGSAVPAWTNRAFAAGILLVSLTVLGLAGWMTPDPAGHGTHEQLGLPPCGLKFSTGLPCATCGMTTAFSHAAHGDLLGALIVQPAGTVLALGTAMAALVSAWALVTNMALAPLGRWLWRPRMALALAGLVLASWAYTLLVTLGS